MKICTKILSLAGHTSRFLPDKLLLAFNLTLMKKLAVWQLILPPNTEDSLLKKESKNISLKNSSNLLYFGPANHVLFTISHKLIAYAVQSHVSL